MINILTLSLVLGSTWKAYFHQEGKIHLVTLIFIECPYCQLICGMNSETCDGYAFFCRTPWGLLLNRAWHMKRWASRHSLRIMLSYPRSSEFLVFYIIAINKIWRNNASLYNRSGWFKTCVRFLNSSMKNNYNLEDTLIDIIAKHTASRKSFVFRSIDDMPQAAL